VVCFWEAESIGLELKNNNIAMYWRDGRMVSFESKGEDAVRYDALCTKYNDLSYNKKTRYIEYIGCREYSSNEIFSIDVTTAVDFDEEHPAGSSLGDVVRLLSASPIKFIQSGYKETFDWNTQYPKEFLKETNNFDKYFCFDDVLVAPHHHPVQGLLTELKQDDLQLLGLGYSIPSSADPNSVYGYFFGYLTFEKEPAEPGVHELTVTVRLADGRMLSQTIEKKF
jgi:hypothetical protein